MVTIKVRQNGPYLVEGDDVMLVDWNGAPYQIPKRPFALCRCGGSMTKPFCDGTHSKAGFKAAEAAVPGSQDRPATEVAGRTDETGFGDGSRSNLWALATPAAPATSSVKLRATRRSKCRGSVVEGTHSTSHPGRDAGYGAV